MQIFNHPYPKEINFQRCTVSIEVNDSTLVFRVSGKYSGVYTYSLKRLNNIEKIARKVVSYAQREDKFRKELVKLPRVNCPECGEERRATDFFNKNKMCFRCFENQRPSPSLSRKRLFTKEEIVNLLCDKAGDYSDEQLKDGIMLSSKRKEEDSCEIVFLSTQGITDEELNEFPEYISKNFQVIYSDSEHILRDYGLTG